MLVSKDPTTYWADPSTRQAYPLSYDAYRRAREAEDPAPPRHQGLDPAADQYVWDRWRVTSSPEVEVLLTMHPDAPPRIRRMAGEILRAIRRGRPADEAIRHVSRRFGLRQGRAHACLAACREVRVRPIPEDPAPPAEQARWPFSRPADWM
jgi:hypothetical protein